MLSHPLQKGARVQCKECFMLGEPGKKRGSVVATHTVHCRTVPLFTFQMRLKLDLCIAEKYQAVLLPYRPVGLSED